jgi:actin-related protein
MQGQQHDIHAMMALVQSLAQGGGGAAALEQQMSMLKLQQEQVLQERERLAAEIAKMQSMQGGSSSSSSSSSSKKDETLDAAVVAAEKQEEAATELEALRLDSAAIASLSSHELAAKAQSLGVTPGSDDDDALRARLIEHVARKSQMLSASVDAEKLRQEQAMQERMQRLKTEREAARSKLASAIAAAESGDVTVAAAAAADAAAAAAAATGDASVISTIDTADSGETDDEKRQKLVKQLQVGEGTPDCSCMALHPSFILTRGRRPWRRWTAVLAWRKKGRMLRCSK